MRGHPDQSQDHFDETLGDSQVEEPGTKQRSRWGLSFEVNNFSEI
jgi:hypothetical protein